MTDAPKYVPADGEPAIWIVHVTDQPDILDGYLVRYSGEIWWPTHEEAQRGRQEYAIAIANRVHGAELARLRAVEENWIDLVKRLRGAMIDLLRANDSDMLIGTGVADTFDEASMAVGLPISNDDAVPFELLKPGPAVDSDELARDIASWCAANPHLFQHMTIAETIAEWKASQR